MTRCKKDDIAFFRKGVNANLNKFVTVLRQANPGLGRRLTWRDSGVWWEVEASSPIIWPCGHAHGTTRNGKFYDFVPDDHLTPLRDQPGQDETLTWASKPEKLSTPTTEPETV